VGDDVDEEILALLRELKREKPRLAAAVLLFLRELIARQESFDESKRMT
jgi:hypothetical protein